MRGTGGPARKRPSYRLLLAVDIQGYGRAQLTDPVRDQMRQHLAGWAVELFSQAGVDASQWMLQDTGDGWLASLDSNEQEDLLLVTVITGLHHRLVGYNADKPERTQMHVRMAIHGGYVVGLLVGEATNDVCRLLDAEVLRKCLKATPQPLVVMASEWLYGGIIKHGYPGIDPTVWHRMSVDTKEGPRQGWVHVPGDPDAPQRAFPLAQARASTTSDRRAPARQPRSAAPPPPMRSAAASAGSSVIHGLREERKVVTALIAGLGSTLGDTTDPEDARGGTDSAVALILAQVRRYGGVVQTRLGGRILAVFGVPRSHGHDPESAVRAALEVCEQFQISSAGLQVRVGVATGEALVSHHDEDSAVVTGDIVHVAGALQELAPPCGVAVGAGTYRATRRVIQYRPLHAGPQRVAGSMAWQALASRARSSIYIGDRPAPLIERERELALVADVIGRFLRDREAQVLTLVSEPGLGKTRLVAELAQLIDQAIELVGYRVAHCHPYGQGVLGALVEIIKAHCGILDGDNTQTAQDKLRVTTAHLVSDEGAQLTESLRSLLGADGVEQLPSHRQRLLDDTARFLSLVAAYRPLVVVFEDLQWADDLLLEFIDRLLDSAGPVPLLVVATGRTEFLDRRPGWGGGQRNAITLSLSPLTRKGTGALLDALHGRLPAATRDELLVASGGNPLYVEEYVRMLAEEDADPHALVEGPWPVPETVQQLITARLDTLQLEDRLLLQDASVIGEIGWAGALAAVSGRARVHVEAAIRRLERRGLLRRIRVSSVAGEIEYAFRHTLIREVAYGQLLRAERAAKHQRVAHWQEALNPDSEDRIELLAYHYRRALELVNATGRADDTLAERTRLVLRSAGDRALRFKAGPAAERHYLAALELWPPDAPDRPELLFRLELARSWRQP